MNIEIPAMIRVSNAARTHAIELMTLSSKLGFLDEPSAILQAALVQGLKVRVKRLKRLTPANAN